MFRSRTEPAKPIQIRPGHRTLTIHIGAKKRTTVRLKRSHLFFGPQRQLPPPTIHHNPPFRCVQSNHHSRGRQFLRKPPQKPCIDLTFAKNSTTDDDLIGAPSRNFLRSRHRPNPSTNTNFESVALARFQAKIARDSIIVASTDSRIQVN